MLFGHRLFMATTPMLLLMTAYGTRLLAARSVHVAVAALVLWNMYLFIGTSVAKLEGSWNPRLSDAMGWEHRLVPAVRHRYGRERP